MRQSGVLVGRLRRAGETRALGPESVAFGETPQAYPLIAAMLRPCVDAVGAIRPAEPVGRLREHKILVVFCH